MNSKKEVNYHYVMSRMEWFRDLKLIYNKLLKQEDILTPLEKVQILKELNRQIQKLELKSPEEYYSKSQVQAFSLAEIFAHINSLEDPSINFDQLIDSLIYLSIEKKRKEKKNIGIVKFHESQTANDSLVPNFCVKHEEKTKKIEENERDSEEITTKINENLLQGEGKIRKVEDFQKKPGLIKQKIEGIFKIKENDKEYEHAIVKSPILSTQTTLDLSFPSETLSTSPDLRKYSNLLYLSLCGNSISSTKSFFPPSLKVLNLSCNKISEFCFEQDLESLQLLNLTSNQISIIQGINKIKNIKELFIANNCVASLNMLCHLNSLVLLDCSHNEIETFEDIAGLVISKRIGILKLRGNPLSTKLNYDQVVTSILPRIYNLDPLNIIDFSSFKQLGSLPFLPLKDILQEAEEKTTKPSRINLSNIKSENYIVLKKKSHIENSPTEVPKYAKEKINSAPLTAPKNCEKMKRSASQIRIEKSSVFTSTSKTSVGFMHETSKKSAEEGNIMDIAERRIKVFNEVVTNRSNVSVISNESIMNVKKKVYGNPVAAMMIGPPAVTHGKVRVPSKSPACVSLDLSKKRRDNR